MPVPAKAQPQLLRLLTFAQRRGLVFAPASDGSLALMGEAELPPQAIDAIAQVGPAAAAALEELAIPAPGIAQTVLWWELAAERLSPEGRAFLPLATAARRQRMLALRSVHLAALADVVLATAGTAPPR